VRQVLFLGDGGDDVIVPRSNRGTLPAQLVTGLQIDRVRRERPHRAVPTPDAAALRPSGRRLQRCCPVPLIPEIRSDSDQTLDPPNGGGCRWSAGSIRMRAARRFTIARASSRSRSASFRSSLIQPPRSLGHISGLAPIAVPSTHPERTSGPTRNRPGSGDLFRPRG